MIVQVRTNPWFFLALLLVGLVAAGCGKSKTMKGAEVGGGSST
jgi:F0F1-type ATP synthase assembly protein I